MKSEKDLGSASSRFFLLWGIKEKVSENTVDKKYNDQEEDHD